MTLSRGPAEDARALSPPANDHHVISPTQVSYIDPESGADKPPSTPKRHAHHPNRRNGPSRPRSPPTLSRSPAITQLSILSRRDFPLPPGAGSEKARVIVHKDFLAYDDPVLVESLKGAEGCVWAQGVSANDVSKEEYVNITVGYPVAAAKAFAPLSDKFKFVYVSSEGADPTEKSYTYFARIKGRAETHLLSLPSSSPSLSSLRMYNVRPFFIDPGPGNWHRNESFLFTSVAAPILRVVLPTGLHTPTDELARTLVDLAIGDGRPVTVRDGKGVEAQGRTLRSSVIRRWGEVWGTAADGETIHTEF